MVGSGHQRILRRHRNRRGRVLQFGGISRPSRHGRQGGRGRKGHGDRREWRRALAGRHRRGRLPHIDHSRLHLSRRRREAAPRRKGRPDLAGRCRLSRPGRLSLSLRPRQGHGDFGRRQHLPGRDRGRVAQDAGCRRLRRLRHSGRRVRRGALRRRPAAAGCRAHGGRCEDLSARTHRRLQGSAPGRVQE